MEDLHQVNPVLDTGRVYHSHKAGFAVKFMRLRPAAWPSCVRPAGRAGPAVLALLRHSGNSIITGRQQHHLAGIHIAIKAQQELRQIP